MNKNFYITTRTPLRVSFFGGGTDFEEYYKKKTGSVLSVTINKFVYVTIKKHNKLFNENYRINYSSVEHKHDLKSINNLIVKECLKKVPLQPPLSITISSDIPSNSGLGSSSAITVGLLKALYTAKGKKVTNHQLAEEACEIEINLIKNNIGKQDQYAVTFGGLNYIKFTKKKIVVSKINKKNIINKILKNSILIWTGQYRKATDILKKHKTKILQNKQAQLDLLHNYAVKGQKLFTKKNFNYDNFYDLIRKNWEAKNNFNNLVSNPIIERISKILDKERIFSYKLLGAGGGGFILAFIDKNKINSFKRTYKKLNIIDFSYTNKGSETIIKNFY